MDMETHDRETFALPELDYSEPPAGSDRRAFMMQSAMVAAIVAVGGRASPLFAQVPAQAPPLGSGGVDPNLEVVKKIQGSGDDPGRRVLQSRVRDRPRRTRSVRCGSPTISTSARPSCRPTSLPRRRRSRCICSAASARPARAMARSARRWPASSVMSRRRSIRCRPRQHGGRAGQGLTRSSSARRRSTSRSRTSSTTRPRAISITPTR